MNIEKVISGNNSAQSSAKTNKATGGTAFSNVLGSLIGSNNNYLEDIFAAASRKYGVSLDLLKAVAKTESNFNPSATSRCGAMGVMQLMPETAAGLGVTDAYDPEQNIMGGAKLLNRLLNRYNGQTELALAAYNAGTGNVDKYGGIPPYKETQSYVSIIMNYLGAEAALPYPINTTIIRIMK
jgi:soluble lytic murein transglycosylase-like protein